MTGDAWSLLGCVCLVAVTVAIGALRLRAHASFLDREEQLNNSHELFLYHSRLLQEFVENPSSPEKFKGYLISFSDLITDRDWSRRFSEAVLRRPLGSQMLDPDALELLEQLAAFGTEEPELVVKFTSAIVCAALGATLRYPENAKSFEALASRLVVDNSRQEVAVAVTATRQQRPRVEAGLTRQHAMA